MKAKSTRTVSVLLIMIMTATAFGAFSLTAGADYKINQRTWGEMTVAGVLSYADLSFMDDHVGTEEDPYEISTAAQLAGFAALVNANNGSPVALTDAWGNTATATDFFANGEKQHVKLTADIDLSEHSWMPIGIGTADTEGVFAGGFDGAGHTVSGMTIGTSSMPEDRYQNAGLFGYVSMGGIKDLTVSGSVNLSCPSGKARVGGLVGYLYAGKIVNCHSGVNVTVSQNTTAAPCYVGGVVGHGSPFLDSRHTSIIGCTNSGTVTVMCTCFDTLACYVGGVAGYIENMNSPFINCFNSGSVTGGTYTGGVVGYAKNDHEMYREMGIYNCANVGSVTGNRYAGGIVGYTDSLAGFANCYHAGSVSGANAGGIVGDTNNAGATFCYWLSTSVEAASGDGEGYFDDCSALSEAQIKAAAGTTDESWEKIFFTKAPIALVDALNAYAKENIIHNVACIQWHICSVAGASVYPTYDSCSYTDNGDGNTHKKLYECCGVVVDEEDHFRSNTVTCLGTVCEGCGAYYGATNSIYHVSTESVYRPDETEPYDYHNQHHACCGALIEDTQERHNDFTYTMEQINDSEQYVFTKTCLTCNGDVGKQYITVADRPYSGTPYAYATDEIEGNFGLLEGTYCHDGGCINAGEHTLTFVLSSQHRFEIPFTITKAPLTVTANSVTVAQKDGFPEFTYTAEGFCTYTQYIDEAPYEIERTDDFTTNPTVKVLDADGNEVTDTSETGTYRIVYTGGVNDNYEITYVEGSLTVIEHQKLNEYGYCEKCQVRITGASITVGTDLTMKYYVGLYDETIVGEGQKLAMCFTMNGKTVTVYANEALVDSEYVFEFENIAPQCMTDLIDATLMVVDENDEVVDTLAEKRDYSVKANAEALLEEYGTKVDSASKALVQLVTDMLTYGAASQNYKDYNNENPEDLASAGVANLGTPSESLPTESKKNVTASTSETVYFTSATVWFDYVNKIGVMLSTTENVKLVVNGVEVELTGTTYYTDAIYATGFDTVYTFELYEGNTLVQTFTYSVSSYVYAMMNKVDDENNPTEMAELARALYRYGASALAYEKIQASDEA